VALLCSLNSTLLVWTQLHLTWTIRPTARLHCCCCSPLLLLLLLLGRQWLRPLLLLL
jgi:hypothetical protein